MQSYNYGIFQIFPVDNFSVWKEETKTNYLAHSLESTKMMSSSSFVSIPQAFM